jgi:hypothetical protein
MSIAENPGLDRLLDPFANCLNVESAERIARFQIDAKVQARINELAEKSNDGLLTPEERAEYKSYIDAADLITIFKLKAKRLLRPGNASQ